MNILDMMIKKLYNLKCKMCELEEKNLLWLISEFNFRRLLREVEPINYNYFMDRNEIGDKAFGIPIKITYDDEIMLVQRVDK